MFKHSECILSEDTIKETELLHKTECCDFYFLLSDLIHCTNEMNVNVPQLADTLFERTANSSWVVVFKALITTHHLMMYGNEVRFAHPHTHTYTLVRTHTFFYSHAVLPEHSEMVSSQSHPV